RAARPLPTIAQRMVQPKVHGMRPEEGTRRLAPLLDPRPVGIRPQKVVPGLLGKIAFGRGMRLDPREARAGILDPGLVDVRKSEHRGQEQPLTAAVVAVLEVTVDTPVYEERLLDPLDELRRADEKQRPVDAIVRPGKCVALDLVGAQAVADAPERRGVDAFALFPPVDTRLVPV